MIVHSIITEPSAPVAGQPAVIKFFIDNAKPTTISKSFYSKLYIDDVEKSSYITDGLADGFYAIGEYTATLSSGVHTIKVETDTSDSISETDESNNAKSITKTWSNPTAQYDLVITEISTPNPNPVAGQPFNINYTVWNKEPTAKNTPFKSKLFINDVEYLECSHPDVISNEYVQICSRDGISLSSGSYVVKAYADYYGSITETDESNNVFVKTLTVSPSACPIPDGTSESCDCDMNSECPSSRPYCEDEFPSPISDGYDSCVATKPLYCGDGICNNGENWGSCSADCSAPNARVSVDVVTNGISNPIKGSSIYLDESFKGTTDTNGRFVFTSPYGSRTIKVNCPDGNYCDSRGISLDGDEYVRISCDCDTSSFDTDGDGYLDKDEELVGSDPYDASSTWSSLLFPNTAVSGCFDLNPMSIIIGLTNDEKQKIANSFNSVSAENYKNIFAEEQSLASYLGIDESKFVDYKLPLAKSYESSSNVKILESEGSLIFIIENYNETINQVAIYKMLPNCVGVITGLVAGAGNGLKDDITGVVGLIYLIKDGFSYFFLKLKIVKLTEMNDDFKSFMNNLDEAWKNRDTLFYNAVLSIYEKGSWLTQKTGIFKTGEDYSNFQIGFFKGYIVGYVAEQVFLLKGIGKALSALKIGQKLTRAGTKLSEIITKISGKIEDKVLILLSKSKYVAAHADDIARWSNEGAELGLGRISNYLDDVDKFDNYLDDISDLEKFSENVNEVAVKYDDDTAEILVKSKYGKKFLKACLGTSSLTTSVDVIPSISCTDWSVDELKGLSEIIKKYGDDFVKRLSSQFSDDIIRNIGKGIGEGIIDINKVAPEQLGRYIQYSSINPLDDAAGVDKLVNMFKAPRIKITIGKNAINDVTVLRKGTNSWGWEHIRKKHITGEIPDGSTFPNIYGISDETEIKQLIQESIEKGTRSPDGAKWIYEYTPFEGKPIMRTVIDVGYPSYGGITTSFPVGG